MKNNINLCVVMMVCFALSACATSARTPVLVGRKAPLVQLYKVDGDQVSISEYRGKTVVLLFWAQWCSRSQRTIRQLNDFARGNAHRAVVVAVDIDKADKLEELKSLIANVPLKMVDHYFSGNEIYDEAYVAFNAGEIPSVYILSPEGMVVAQGTNIDVVREYFKLD